MSRSKSETMEFSPPNFESRMAIPIPEIKMKSINRMILMRNHWETPFLVESTPGFPCLIIRNPVNKQTESFTSHAARGSGHGVVRVTSWSQPTQLARFGASPYSGPVTGHLRRRGLGQSAENRGDVGLHISNHNYTSVHSFDKKYIGIFFVR